MAEEQLTEHDKLMELDARQREHEAMCEERWKTCFNRLQGLDDSVGRLETILIGVAGTIIVGGASVLLTILMMHQ
tara:strand:- start:1764 stop:1988 length:225 start_codon:yes stop_codon:yes gene_type:complete